MKKLLFLALILAHATVFAQSNMRVRGTITSLDGDVLSVKSRDGKDMKLHLTSDAQVAVAKKISLADIKPGRLKALATGASRRIAELPDVPTVRELGYPMLEAEGWNGFFAPAKTPREVLERLNREFATAVKHPDVAKRMREMAAEPVGSSGAEQEAIFKRQMDQFRPIIKEMRIEG